MSKQQLRKHILSTYFWLRLGMAIIGIVFPLVLWLVGLIVGYELQGSISAYYHTPMRDVFVGSLCAIGAFLFLYKGYSGIENHALNVAGVFAVIIALFPTSLPSNIAIQEYRCEAFTAPLVHGIAAIIFFLSIAFVSIFLSPQSVKNLPEKRRRVFTLLYRCLGAGMVVLPLLIVVLLKLLGETQSLVFWVELVAVWNFSAYWIVKTIEFMQSNLDKSSCSISNV